MIHRRSHRQDADLAVGQAVPILRRHRRSADEAALRVCDEIIEEEFRRFLHRRIARREKRAIAAEEVVLPQMLREPRRAHRPQPRARQIAGAREAPDVGDVMRHESSRAVVNAGCLSSRLAQRLDEVEQRQVAFGEIRDFRRPVVHLQIDVQVVVAVPWRVHAVGPESLQVGG